MLNPLQQDTRQSNRSYLMGLPTELLMLIFKFSLYGDDNYRAGRTPRVLSQLPRVCSVWREIAFGMPELWDTLSIQRPILLDDFSKVREISEWISHSGTRPLSLGLTFQCGGLLRHQVALNLPWTRLIHLDILDEEINPMLARQILAHATSLVSCRFFRMTGHTIRENIYDQPPIILCHLKILCIQFVSETYLAGTPLSRQAKIYPVFQPLVLPALEELEIITTHSSLDRHLTTELRALQSRSNSSLIRFHLSNIKVDINDLFEFLRAVPTLVELRLNSTEIDGNYPDLLGRLAYIPELGLNNILPKLEVLTVTDDLLPSEWNSVDAVIVGVLESRWWPDLCHANSKAGLARLRCPVIKWVEYDWIRVIGDPTVRGRAIGLSCAGMQVQYSSLCVGCL
jgi:hypothetical protein